MGQFWKEELLIEEHDFVWIEPRRKHLFLESIYATLHNWAAALFPPKHMCTQLKGTMADTIYRNFTVPIIGRRIIPRNVHLRTFLKGLIADAITDILIHKFIWKRRQHQYDVYIACYIQWFESISCKFWCLKACGCASLLLLAHLRGHMDLGWHV